MSKRKKHKKTNKLKNVFNQEIINGGERKIEEKEINENIWKESIEEVKKWKNSFLDKIKKQSLQGDEIKEEETFKEKSTKKLKELQNIFLGKIKDRKNIKEKDEEVKDKKELDTNKEFDKEFSNFENNLFLEVKDYYQKAILVLKKWNNIFCTGMTCRVNLKRDIIIISVAILVAAIFLGLGQYIATIKNKLQNRQTEVVSSEKLFIQSEIENSQEIATIQEKIDISSWKEYQSAWYGFKIKYPQDWKAPLVRPYNRLSKASYRVSFLTNNEENKNFIGFDVAVYDTNKVKEFFATDEFPKLKDVSADDSERCADINDHVMDTGDYPAEEIYIPQTDDCYNSVLFFSVVAGQYMYNITPRLKDGVVTDNDPMVELSDNLPEFFSAISQFENIDIVRPKPKPIAPPKPTAPMPYSYKKVDGKRVCAKKNDHPSKSDKNKGKHLDMECCLDPDEYPNPNCYYSVSKYGKYLK
ncbi:MAG: hypothetical protein WC682_01035 [Parcubacteria group bacterium]|jgi:hypothetical protein